MTTHLDNRSAKLGACGLVAAFAALVITVAGCASDAAVEAGESSTPPSALTEKLEYHETKQGTVGLIHDDDVQSLVREGKIEAPEELGAWFEDERGEAQQLRWDEDEGEASGFPLLEKKAPKCWVKLLYCRDPRRTDGAGTCSQNGGCTLERFVSACVSLYRDICL